tara:strand:- start:168 stop:398 length:231 start_codon:yes stop_codon:yes gene_type:complete
LDLVVHNAVAESSSIHTISGFPIWIGPGTGLLSRLLNIVTRLWVDWDIRAGRGSDLAVTAPELNAGAGVGGALPMK